MTKTRILKSTVFGAAAAALVAFASAASAADIGACLITKTDTNPFFVKMKEGATAKAEELGVDAARPMPARSTATMKARSRRSKPASPTAPRASCSCRPTPRRSCRPVKKARDAGILVIALDTPLDPIDAADATFATDNFKAGELIGAWAKATLGDEAKDAKIAFLDLNPSQPTVDVLRDQGFMNGFGIDTKDVNKIGDEDDPRIVGHDVTNGNEEGGRKAMENLLQKDPAINVVYTINEPAAAGAYEALKAVGKEKATC